MMTADKQALLLSLLLSDRNLCIQVNSILKAEYFDVELRKSVTFIKDYLKQYNTPPSIKQLKVETGVDIVKTDSASQTELDYALNEIELFCRRKAIEKAVLSSPALIEKGDYREIEKQITDAVSVGLSKNIGLDYFQDPDKRLQEMMVNQAPIPTGLEDLDKNLCGGLSRKEMTLFMANSGAGKSLVMSNLAINFVKQKYNVLYITLELSEAVVAKRLDSIFTGVRQDKVFEERVRISQNIETVKDGLGSLVIKRMPETTTSTSDIKSYLTEYERIKGLFPDVIVVDYMDLMASDKKIPLDNLFVRDKYIAEELRSLGNKTNSVIVTASQMGRTAINTENLTQAHIQGGISKVNTCDNLIAIVQSEANKSAGVYLFKLLKLRSSGSTGRVIKIPWDKYALRLGNLHQCNEVSQKKEQVKQPTRKQLDNSCQSNGMPSTTPNILDFFEF